MEGLVALGLVLYRTIVRSQVGGQQLFNLASGAVEEWARSLLYEASVWS